MQKKTKRNWEREVKYIVLMLIYLSYSSFKKPRHLCVKSGLALGFDRVSSYLFSIILEVLLFKKNNTHIKTQILHPNSSSEMKVVNDN